MIMLSAGGRESLDEREAFVFEVKGVSLAEVVVADVVVVVLVIKVEVVEVVLCDTSIMGSIAK
jgi:hypothetical protein